MLCDVNEVIRPSSVPAARGKRACMIRIRRGHDPSAAPEEGKLGSTRERRAGAPCCVACTLARSGVPVAVPLARRAERAHAQPCRAHVAFGMAQASDTGAMPRYSGIWGRAPADGKRAQRRRRRAEWRVPFRFPPSIRTYASSGATTTVRRRVTQHSRRSVGEIGAVGVGSTRSGSGWLCRCAGAGRMPRDRGWPRWRPRVWIRSRGRDDRGLAGDRAG